MRKKWKKAGKALLLLMIFLAVGYLAGGIPFYVYPETEEFLAAPLLTGEWWEGLLPIGIILLTGLLLAIISARICLRKKGNVKLFHLKRYKKGQLHRFVILRWIVMSLSFILIIYGGKVVGHSLYGIDIPVFSCPFNEDQLIGASCYFLSHVQVLLESGPVKIVTFVISFLISSILLGRVICGFICPMGFIQDLLHILRQRLHMESVRSDEKTYQKLNVAKCVFLIAFLGLWIIGGDFCMLCPVVALSPAMAGFQVSLYAGGFFMVIVVAMSFLKRRAFCNICPLGYLVGLLHPVSLFKIKKNAVSCTECGACYEACPMGIKSILTTREGKKEKCIDVTTADCIMCGECIRKCPENDALAMTLAGKKIYTASRMAFMKEYAIKTDRKEKNQA